MLMTLTGEDKRAMAVWKAREMIDGTFHSPKKYDAPRIALQDCIISDILNTGVHGTHTEGRSNEAEGHMSSEPGGDSFIAGKHQEKQQWLVLMAGPMGSGKTYTARWLREKGYLGLSHPVVIDMDMIRVMLPEMVGLRQRDPVNAGVKTQRESGLIAELCLSVALGEGRSVIFDGTLKNTEWYGGLVQQVRQQTPAVSCAIVHVWANSTSLFKRCDARARHTARLVPRSVVRASQVITLDWLRPLFPLMDLVLSLQNSEHAVAVRSSVSNSNSNSNITGPGTGSSARDDGDNGGGGGGRSAGGGTEALVCGSPRLAYPEGLSWHSVASLFALRRTVCVCSDQEAAAAMEQKQALEDEEQSRAPPRSSTVSPALRSSTRALTLSLNSSGSSGNSDSRGGDGDDDGDSLGAGASLFSDQDKHSSGGITSDDSDDNGNNLNGSINSSDHHRGQQQQQQQPRRLRTVPTAEPTAGPTTKTSCLPCRVDGLRTSCPAALESTPFARLSTPRSPPSPPHRGSSLTRDRGAKSGLQQQQQPEKPGRAPSVKSRVAVRAAETTLPPRRIHRVPPLNLSRTAPATTAIWEGNGIGKGLIVDTAPSPRSPIGLVASLAARECQSLLSSPGLTDCLERMMQEEEDAAEREIFDWYMSSPSPDKALTGGTSVSSERAEDWEVALDSLDVALDLALEADCSSSGGVVCLCVPELHLEEDDDWELEEEEDGVVLQQQCTPGPDRLTEAASTTSDSSTSTSSTSSRSRYGNSTNNNSSSKSPLPHSPLTVMARLKGHARTPAPAPAPAHEHVSLDTGSDSKGGGGAARFKECLSPCGSPSPFCKSGNGGGGGGGRSKQPSKSACPHRPPLTAD